MELMLLVYAVENLSYNGSFFFSFIQLLLAGHVILALVLVFYAAIMEEIEGVKSFLKNSYPKKTIITLVSVCLLLHTLLPQRQTAIYMVGAYAAQEVLTADKTQELGNKTYLAISNQLDKWAEEVPELKGLIEDSVTEKVKEELIE